MENISADVLGRMTEGMLRYCLAPEGKVQMIVRAKPFCFIGLY